MNVTEHKPNLSPDSRDMSAWANLLRAAILAIPEAQRNAAFEQVVDVLPSIVALRKLAPQRGGPLLHNVYDLFKRDPSAQRTTADVVAALEKQQGMEVPPMPVRYALNYLQNRRVLRRVGYGLYQLQSGEVVQGPV